MRAPLEKGWLIRLGNTVYPTNPLQSSGGRSHKAFDVLNIPVMWREHFPLNCTPVRNQKKKNQSHNLLHNGSNTSSFDGGSPQSWGTEHSLSLHAQWGLLVAGHALWVSAEVRLDGFPDFLLWIEHSVWFTYTHIHTHTIKYCNTTHTHGNKIETHYDRL